MSNYLYLSSPKAEAASVVMLRIRVGNSQAKISTKVQCEPASWDAAVQCVLSSDPLYKHKNALLASWLLEADKAVLKMQDEGTTLAVAKESILKAKNRTTEKKPDGEANSLLLYYYDWATTKTQSRTPTAQNLLSWRILQEFRNPIAFEDATAAFYEDFCLWMDNVKGYKTNMKGTQIKNLKAVMNSAYKKGLHHNTAYQFFKKPTEEVDNVYLTEAELDALYNLPLSGYRAKARDIFLVGCYTAMRWSDYSRLRQKDITDGTIHFAHKKTGFRVTIPLHPIVAEVLERYGGAVPDISEQKLNKYIKEVCRDAGITSPVTKVYYKGGVRTELVKEKCDLVSTHTARRTAATNMYKSGIPAYNIMLITGHTSEATFRKYIKFEKEQNADYMKNNPYFQKRK